MKKTGSKLLIGAILGAILTVVLIKLVFPLFNGSAIKNSFYEVTAKLDAGGEVYAYWHAERLIQKIDQIFEKLTKMAVANGGTEAQQAQKVFAVIRQLLNDSGINEISGVGFSSIARKVNLFRSTFVVHHYPDKNKGLMWNLGETQPRPLSELELLPAATAIAGSSDFNPQKLWAALLKEVDAFGLPEVKNNLLNMDSMLQAQGIDFKKLLGGFGNRSGWLLTLDSAKPITIPVEGKTLEIPQPGMALFFAVKDNYIFDLLQSKLPMAQKLDEKGIKKLRFPKLPLPIPLEPIIVQKGNWLIVASTTDLAEAMINNDRKTPRLTASDEYKRLAAGLPSSGNGFRYLSPEVLKQISLAITKMTASAGAAAQNPAGKEFLNMLPADFGFYGISQNVGDGFVFTFNHTFDSGALMLLPATAGIGVVSAIAIPNLLVAMQKGKETSTMADLKMISTAIESYIVDNGKLPQGETLAELREKLEPQYSTHLPQKDAWGNDILFKRGTATDEYMLASAGRDGQFNGWEQKGAYALAKLNDFDNDIIMKNGTFVFAPEKK